MVDPWRYHQSETEKQQGKPNYITSICNIRHRDFFIIVLQNIKMCDRVLRRNKVLAHLPPVIHSLCAGDSLNRRAAGIIWTPESHRVDGVDASPGPKAREPGVWRAEGQCSNSTVRQRANSALLCLFVLLKSSVEWRRFVHTGEGHLLYSLPQFKWLSLLETSSGKDSAAMFNQLPGTLWPTRIDT